MQPNLNELQLKLQTNMGALAFGYSRLTVRFGSTVCSLQSSKVIHDKAGYRDMRHWCLSAQKSSSGIHSVISNRTSSLRLTGKDSGRKPKGLGVWIGRFGRSSDFVAIILMISASEPPALLELQKSGANRPKAVGGRSL